MSRYSAYEGQHFSCSCCQESEIKCKPVNITSSTGRPIGEGEAGETFKVPDSTITNSDNTYSYNLPATVDFELPDIPNVDSDGTVIYTPAQTPFICTNFQASTVVNTDGTELGQTEAGVDFVVGDVQVTLLNTLVNFISITNYPSGVPGTLFAPDATIDINSGFFFTTPSNETENIDIIDSSGNIIPIISQTSDTVEVGVVANNTNYRIENTLGTLIDTAVIPPGTTATVVLPDISYTVMSGSTVVGTGVIKTLENGAITILI